MKHLYKLVKIFKLKKRILIFHFRDPEDVDLFVGLNFEDSVALGHVGPVSACLIAEQFRVLAEGDRFFVAHRSNFNPGISYVAFQLF